MSLLLRPPTPDDASQFLEMVAASRALHHPWVAPPADRDAYDAWLARFGETYQGLCAFRDDGVLVGVLNLAHIFRGPFQNAYLSYYANAANAGQGHMTTAVRMTLDHAFGPLGLHRLEANIRPENTASRSLVKKVGFRLEGFSPRYLFLDGAWRDHERWAICAEDLG